MMAKRHYLFLIWLLLAATQVFADNNHLHPMNPWQQWTFTGNANDEDGNVYYYYFAYQQHDDQRKVDVVVLSEQLQPIISYHKVNDKAPKNRPKHNSWKVGRSFFRYNPITKNWVFGLKAKEDKGFDFKVDIRPADGDMGERQRVSDELTFEMSQFHQLTGHLFFFNGNQELFVSANRGWLRYIEDKKPPKKLTALICNRRDGSGLYSLQLDSPKAKKAAIVGMRNSVGEREKVSQFLRIKSLDEKRWQLTIPSPRTNWTLNLVTRFMNRPFETLVIGDREESVPIVCFYQKHYTTNYQFESQITPIIMPT
ncbi:hypothetical protein [Legionella sp. W05-934-2]|jgi:hypothetical protein|uniref:hypothetical protein n=1 Tax=Legionella sp. W05-934-2 TaxID=1198649 RepID=UPI003463030B